MAEQDRGKRKTDKPATAGAGAPGNSGTGSEGSSAGGVSGRIGERGTTKGEWPTADLVGDRSSDDDSSTLSGGMASGTDEVTEGEVIAGGATTPTTAQGMSGKDQEGTGSASGSGV